MRVGVARHIDAGHEAHAGSESGRSCSGNPGDLNAPATFAIGGEIHVALAVCRHPDRPRERWLDDYVAQQGFRQRPSRQAATGWGQRVRPTPDGGLLCGVAEPRHQLLGKVGRQRLDLPTDRRTLRVSRLCSEQFVDNNRQVWPVIHRKNLCFDVQTNSPPPALSAGGGELAATVIPQPGF